MAVTAAAVSAVHPSSSCKHPQCLALTITLQASQFPPSSCPPVLFPGSYFGGQYGGWLGAPRGQISAYHKHSGSPGSARGQWGYGCIFHQRGLSEFNENVYQTLKMGFTLRVQWWPVICHYPSVGVRLPHSLLPACSLSGSLTLNPFSVWTCPKPLLPTKPPLIAGLMCSAA